MIGVQIKYGNSYFKNITNYGYKYIGEEKHLNYYLNNQSPIFIIIIDEKRDRMNWVKFDINKTMPVGEEKWWIEIPKENKLETNFKEAVFQEANTVNDFREQIKINWDINKIIKQTDKRILAISKKEIIENSFKIINDYIIRMSINKETLINSRASIDIYFPEYSNDSREIFEIPEIMTWLRNSIEIGIPWFYFLDYKQTNRCFNLLVHCYCRVTNIYQTENQYLCNYNKMDLKRFLEKNFNNLNIFMKKNNIGNEINKEITDGIINMLIHN